jgi:hypothetical protein
MERLETKGIGGGFAYQDLDWTECAGPSSNGSSRVRGLSMLKARGSKLRNPGGRQNRVACRCGRALRGCGALARADRFGGREGPGAHAAPVALVTTDLRRSRARPRRWPNTAGAGARQLLRRTARCLPRIEAAADLRRCRWVDPPFGRSRVRGMPFPMEEDEAANPLDGRLLRPEAVVTQAEGQPMG